MVFCRARLIRNVSPPTAKAGRCNVTAVPELSRFFGIIIRMFAEVGAPHHRPHFHAAYQDAIATFALDVSNALAARSLARSSA